MGTVTIASHRGFDSTDFVLLGLTIVIVGLIAWQVISRTRMFRNRH